VSGSSSKRSSPEDPDDLSTGPVQKKRDQNLTRGELTGIFAKNSNTFLVAKIDAVERKLLGDVSKYSLLDRVSHMEIAVCGSACVHIRTLEERVWNLYHSLFL
jgi:hypothetical protein